MITTLPTVAPPTDWTGIAVVVVLCFLVVCVIGYVVHIRRAPGKQMGEDEIERLAELLHAKQQKPLVITTEVYTYDGVTFPDQTKLDEYKAAKAIVDAAKQ